MVLIAVVDDDDQVRRSIQRILRAAGYEVAVFAAGEDFLDSLPAARPALVLVDLKLPGGIDGGQVLSRLAAQKDHIPAIVASGIDSTADRGRVAALGAFAFFCKPFDPDSLLAAIAAALASASPERQAESGSSGRIGPHVSEVPCPPAVAG